MTITNLKIPGVSSSCPNGCVPVPVVEFPKNDGLDTPCQCPYQQSVDAGREAEEAMIGNTFIAFRCNNMPVGVGLGERDLPGYLIPS